MSEPKLSLAFARIAELCIALDQAPLPKHPDCWECQVDKTWWIAVNGHSEQRKTSDGFDVPPFNAVIKYNGWPAGIMDPYGGCIAAGEGANENTFTAALDAAIASATKTKGDAGGDL
jgi:hypothetical protein